MYRLKYDVESDVLTIIISESGKLSDAEEMGDIIVHPNEKGNPSSWKCSRQVRTCH